METIEKTTILEELFIKIESKQKIVAKDMIISALIEEPKKQKIKENKNKMKVIIGLGNPDKKYEKTYHNIGFQFIDLLSQEFEIKVKKQVCRSLIGEGKIGDQKIILAKPLTYMNLSGEAVKEIIKKYKVDLDDVIVVLDDVDIPVGTFRYRETGSGGTHNGLKNIVDVLKTQHFQRLRIGIGKDEKMDLADYVLSQISKENSEKIKQAFLDAKKFLLENLL